MAEDIIQGLNNLEHWVDCLWYSAGLIERKLAQEAYGGLLLLHRWFIYCKIANNPGSGPSQRG
jgi:hypothetical protein